MVPKLKKKTDPKKLFKAGIQEIDTTCLLFFVIIGVCIF